MVDSRTKAEVKIEELGDELKKRFEDIGKQVKDKLVEDFDKILTDDLDDLRSLLEKIVLEQSKRTLRESQRNLEEVIANDFGGSIFGSVLGDNIIPGVFSDSGGGDLRSNDFRQSASQAFAEIGNAIARSRRRNG